MPEFKDLREKEKENVIYLLDRYLKRAGFSRDIKDAMHLLRRMHSDSEIYELLKTMKPKIERIKNVADEAWLRLFEILEYPEKYASDKACNDLMDTESRG